LLTLTSKEPKTLRAIFLQTSSFPHRPLFLLLLFCQFSWATAALAQTRSPLQPPMPGGALGAEKVTIQFVDVELSTITKFISEITKKNFIFDDRLKGTISIIAPSKLSADEAFNLYVSVLELKGFALVPSGVDAYEIVPIQEAKQKGILRSTGEHPVIKESYIAQLIPLKYISVEEAMKFIQPLVSRDGYISSFGPGRLLLVVDSGLNLQKILSLVESVDRASIREEPDIVILRHSSADAVVKILNEGIVRERARAIAGQPMDTEGAGAIADPRLNAVILLGSKRVRETMKALISLIDVPAPAAQGRINVYFLENADATELSKVLEGMLKGVQAQAARPPTPGVAAAPAAPLEAAGAVTITPDKATNSLVIVASPGDYQNLVQVLRKLDIRRNQVFVEAIIAEVTIDNLVQLGTKWRAAVRKDGEPVFVAGVGNVDPSTVQTIITGITGLALGGLGNFYALPNLSSGLAATTTTENGTTIAGGTSSAQFPGYAALFALSEFKGVVNVLSTPQLLTSDNKEAEIMVGENVPFVTGRQSNVQTTTSVFTTVERQDVGVRLKITPQITEGDYVKLEIYQEISAVKAASQDIVINVGPTTTKRSTKTSVVVKDGQTVVIGGLMQEKTEESVSKVPLLGDIPLLGWFFKYKSTTKSKTNLLVFITPHRIGKAEAAAKAVEEKKVELPEAQPAKPYPEGELFLKFKEGVSEEEARSIIGQKRASVREYYKHIRVFYVQLRQGLPVEEAMKEFGAIPQVQYAEPNLTKPGGRRGL
jgi:general secretion pathway protein D